MCAKLELQCHNGTEIDVLDDDIPVIDPVLEAGSSSLLPHKVNQAVTVPEEVVFGDTPVTVAMVPLYLGAGPTPTPCLP